jgi:signal peptidase II
VPSHGLPNASKSRPVDSVSADPEADPGTSDAGTDFASQDTEVAVGARMKLLLGVGAVVFALDQLTKWWATDALDNGRTIDLFWTVRFNLVHNDGAAFSLGSGLTPFIAVAAIGVAVAVVLVGRRIERRSVLLALGLILGGALGNVADRFSRPGEGFLRGEVVDFIDFRWWPVFNLADMGIVIGGVLLVWLMAEREDPKAGEPAPNADLPDETLY